MQVSLMTRMQVKVIHRMAKVEQGQQEVEVCQTRQDPITNKIVCF